MTEIWRKDDGKWSTIGPSGFVNESELHDQIVEAPELLPLSGQPLLAATFREVGIGGGSADVLAFTDKGRPVVIEVKLSKNPEAKRAVVAQTLAYAAGLHRITVRELEERILADHLRQSGHDRLADAVAEGAESSDFNKDEFYGNLEAHLDRGSFRLVIVLDDAPAQLVRLMGYLESITADDITVDLVKVSAYQINDDQILIPQRIDPEREMETLPTWGAAGSGPSSRSSGTIRTKGSGRFHEINEGLNEQTAAQGRILASWAEALEAEGICRLYSVESGDGWPNLRLHLNNERKTFAHFWPHADGIGAWIYRTVTERRAPQNWPRIQEITGVTRGTGGAEATEELRDALAEAYREALNTEPNTEFTQDSGLFRESLADLPEERRNRLTELADWADGLKADGLCRIQSYRGTSGRFTLLMRLPKAGGFATIYNEVDASGWKGVMTLARSVIERHAPATLPHIEAIAGRVGQGTNAEPTPELLDALADAYREAAGTA